MVSIGSSRLHSNCSKELPAVSDAIVVSFYPPTLQCVSIILSD